MAHGVTTALFYIVLSPISKDSNAQNPAWVHPSCAAPAQALTGMAKLWVKSKNIRKAELLAEVGLLRLI